METGPSKESEALYFDLYTLTTMHVQQNAPKTSRVIADALLVLSSQLVPDNNVRSLALLVGSLLSEDSGGFSGIPVGTQPPNTARSSTGRPISSAGNGYLLASFQELRF
jgi:hypothetical protein